MKNNYKSVEVRIGDLMLGGDNPVRLQSMTNTDTNDTAASLAQCIRIIEAGADMVRLTAQGVREAENLAVIKRELRRAGFTTPLIADIHFNPAAAETAARIVEKVRINPGNYADKRASFIKAEFTDAEYAAELERIHERLRPLLAICHGHGTAVRIGVNHGSLSDRIMTRYGNTPLGMAVSAIEFIRICAAESFDSLVLSMKSSNILVMVESVRLLVQMMQKEGFACPLHLGVTEAGEGEDGRIRSAMGIGALLAEGIGDTIRVSLSEPPENEMPVARLIVDSAHRHTSRTLGKGHAPGNAHIKIYEGETTLFLKYNIAEGSELAVVAAVDAAPVLLPRKATALKIDNGSLLPAEAVDSVEAGILQAARIKITRNDYISCPTCGRTRFDLVAAVAAVKKATAHLSGLKIAVMGCVVNGPGEMADADYGYVGAAEGKVHIYRGTEAAYKNVPVDDAIPKLLELIESDQAKR
ncbi:MAG: (E)-4-hydroxy-3-methylbut-2-enyl-diphosphate synthase [Bacteroidales bacterium]